MVEIPNRLPGFIRREGIVGVPASLTNQTCTRDSPGNVPLVLYDNTADYSSGNGARVENIMIAQTGAVAKSTLLFFIKIDASTVWQFYGEVDLPALPSIAADTKPTNYPLRADLGRRIYTPVAQTGDEQGMRGFRINGNSRGYQLGVALGTAIGSLPLLVWLEGGEL